MAKKDIDLIKVTVCVEAGGKVWTREGYSLGGFVMENGSITMWSTLSEDGEGVDGNNIHIKESSWVSYDAEVLRKVEVDIIDK